MFATMCDLTREDSLEGALENAALRYRVMICQLDVSDANSIHAADASILAQTDAIDAVVHNAGVAVAGALEDLPSLIASTSTDKWRCRTFTPPGATPFPTRRVVRSAPPNVCYWHQADQETGPRGKVQSVTAVEVVIQAGSDNRKIFVLLKNEGLVTRNEM